MQALQTAYTLGLAELTKHAKAKQPRGGYPQGPGYDSKSAQPIGDRTGHIGRGAQESSGKA
jgi:hypothetical protein